MGWRRYREATKQMEHEEAPSGFVRLYNYKEPFMPVEKGFGYQGVLLMDGSGKTVQCHICGEWLPSIGKWHLRDHRVTANQYKERFGLDKTTALVSEEYRKKLLNHVPPKRKAWEDFTKEEQEAIVAKYRATMAKGSREKQNQRGTCPAQLIERLRKKKEELGRDPTHLEIASWKETLKKVFGSLAEAYRRAGLEPRDIHSLRNLKTSKEVILQEGIDFYKIHGRPPTLSDHRRGLMNVTYQAAAYRFGNHKAFREAVLKASSRRHHLPN